MKILYFGLARDCTGIGSEDFSIEEGITVRKLWDGLVERHPRLAECREFSRMAVDMRYVADDEVIAGASEIAIIPPVAGG